MKICAAQIRSVAGDIEVNTAQHLRVIELAAAQGANCVFFPELSLIGYEPSLAKALATDITDDRLKVFQRCADAHEMMIGVGLPMSAGPKVKIGQVWFSPNQPRQVYTKRQLHTDELPFFVQGDQRLVLKSHDHTMAPAICYESLQSNHAHDAAALGADIYLASVAKPATALAKAMQHYPAIARRHSMYVIMADGVGPSDNFLSAGQSAAWNRQGELLAQMDALSEGFVLLDTIAASASLHTLAADAVRSSGSP